MTAPRCANCLIGVGVGVTVLANPVFMADDSALILSRRPAYRCSVCAHVWTVGPEPARPTNAVCDFCSDKEPIIALPCRDFVLEYQPGLEARSVGPWAACRGCAKLIRSGSRDGLVERGVLERAGVLLLSVADIPARRCSARASTTTHRSRGARRSYTG